MQWLIQDSLMSLTFISWQGANEFCPEATTHSFTITTEDHGHVAGGGVEGIQRGVVAELTQLTVVYRGAVIHGDVVTVTAALQPEENRHRWL